MKLVVQMLKFEKKEYWSIFFMQDDTCFNGNIYFPPFLLWKCLKQKKKQTNKQNKTNKEKKTEKASSVTL